MIRRNGRVLLQHEFERTLIPAGPVTIRGVRERGRLSIQVAALPVRTFYDPFPLLNHQDSRLGIVWPAGVGLLDLRLSRKRASAEGSSLEQGDLLYDRGEFANALRQYQLQESQTDDLEFRQEAQYKQATCLLELNRTEEAAARLANLLAQPHDRWPPLAGCQLWLLRLRQDQMDEANAVYDSLSIRFDFAEIAALIPEDVRREILKAYRSMFRSISTVLVYNPDLMKDIQRLASVDRFLSIDGRGIVTTQLEVVRGYRMVGDLASALAVTERMSQETDFPTVVRHHSRMLRLTGQPIQAARYLDAVAARKSKARDPRDMMIRLEHIRVAAALGNWQRCEQMVDEAYHFHRTVGPIPSDYFSYLALMKGFMLERRGSTRQANAIWREGYDAIKIAIRSYGSVARTDALNMVILGSLSDALTQEDAQVFFTKLIGVGSVNPVIEMAQAVVNPATMTAAFRDMWRTPRGRKFAEAFAFGSLTLPVRIKTPLVLAVTAYITNTAFQGELSAEQDAMLYAASSMFFDRFFLNGKFTPVHAAQLSLTWRGTTNLLGWGGVAPRLEPVDRGPMAYLFAHRFLRLNQPEQAVKFFETAITDAAENPPLAELARADLDLLKRKRGRLELLCELRAPVRVRVLQGDQEIAVQTLSKSTSLELPAGSYTLEAQSDNELRLSRTKFQLVPAARRVVQLEQLWTTQDSDVPLAGLIPHPSNRVAGTRWQVYPSQPSSLTRQVEWSPDGSLLAIGDYFGSIWLMDANTLQTKRMLVGHAYAISSLDWSPDGKMLASASAGGKVRVWNVALGSTIQELTRAGEKSTLVAWSGVGQYLATVDQNRSLSVWDQRFQLAHRFEEAGSRFQAIAWHPSRPQIAFACASQTKGNSVRVLDLASASEVQSIDASNQQYTALAWSPDGLQLAAGGLETKIQIWSTDDWRPTSVDWQPHARAARMKWSLDSTRLTVSSSDWQVYVWDMADQSAPPVVSKFAEVIAADINDQGSMAVLQQNGQLLITGQGLKELRTETLPQLSIAVLDASVDGQHLAIGTRDGQVSILAANGHCRRVPTQAARNLVALRCSPTEPVFACAFEGLPQVELIRFDGTSLATLDLKGQERALSLAWSPAGDQLLVGGTRGIGYVWSVATASVTKTLEGHAGNVSQADWSTARQMATSDGSGKIRLWDEGGTEQRVIPSSTSYPLRSLRFASDGSSLVSVDGRGTLRWYTSDGQNGPDFSGSSESRAMFSADGQHILSTRGENAVRVWDTEGRLIREQILQVRADALATFGGPTTLVVGGVDGAIRFFDMEQDTPTRITLLLPGGTATFSHNGKLLSTTGPVQAVEEQIQYVLETEHGGSESLTPSQFHRRFGVALPDPIDLEAAADAVK